MFHQKFLHISLLQTYLNPGLLKLLVDSIINSYICKWLKIPISETLSAGYLTQNVLVLRIGKFYTVVTIVYEL